MRKAEDGGRLRPPGEPLGGAEDGDGGRAERGPGGELRAPHLRHGRHGQRPQEGVRMR